jgi:hypothetical protein
MVGGWAERWLALLGWGGGVDRGVGLDREEGADGRALTVGELGAKAGRGNDLLALLGRHLAKIEDGAGHEATAVRGHRREGLHSPVVLLNLRRGHMFQNLVALQGAVALLRVHVIEAGEVVELTLLDLWRQFVKAGLILKGALLIGEGEVLVVLHPLLKMFLVLGGPDAGIGCGTAFDAGLGGRAILSQGGRSCLRLLGKPAGESRRRSEQHKQRRATTEPG